MYGKELIPLCKQKGADENETPTHPSGKITARGQQGCVRTKTAAGRSMNYTHLAMPEIFEDVHFLHPYI